MFSLGSGHIWQTLTNAGGHRRTLIAWGRINLHGISVYLARSNLEAIIAGGDVTRDGADQTG